jgi:hypothetical protein
VWNTIFNELWKDCLAFLEREHLHSVCNTVLNRRAPKKGHTIKYLVTQYWNNNIQYYCQRRIILWYWATIYCLLTTDVNWQYCLLNNLYCYEIFYYMFVHESHNIVCDYWCMLTIMSVEYHIAMKYFTIDHSCMSQYCLLTTDVNWQYCLLSTIYCYGILLLYCTHENHNIVCWLLT